MNETVTRFLDAVTSGTGIPTDLYADDAVLDATVPGWRFAKHGPADVTAQLSYWYADPGGFEDLVRTPLPDGGELVRFLLTWVEGGETMTAHQVHVLGLQDGRISRQHVFCGGRWDEARCKEMANAG
jgi:hypothetical protein